MIPIVREEGAFSLMDMERCCFCREFTPFWTALHERRPGEQVALCPTCAEVRPLIQVPSKRAWCDMEQARTWARGVVHTWQMNTPTWQRVRAGIIRRKRAREFGI